MMSSSYNVPLQKFSYHDHIAIWKNNSSHRRLKKYFWLEKLKNKAEWLKSVSPLFCSTCLCILELENSP